MFVYEWTARQLFLISPTRVVPDPTAYPSSYGSGAWEGVSPSQRNMSRGVVDEIADEESRTIQSSAEWMLHRAAFTFIMEVLGQVDLFATRLNTQLPHYVSWQPVPYVTATELSRSHGQQRHIRLFPLRINQQMHTKDSPGRSMMILVAPVWRAQPWFPALLELSADYPFLPAVDPDLLRDIQQKTFSTLPSTSCIEGLREQHVNTGFRRGLPSLFVRMEQEHKYRIPNRLETMV